MNQFDMRSNSIWLRQITTEALISNYNLVTMVPCSTRAPCGDAPTLLKLSNRREFSPFRPFSLSLSLSLCASLYRFPRTARRFGMQRARRANPPRGIREDSRRSIVDINESASWLLGVNNAEKSAPPSRQLASRRSRLGGYRSI